MVFVAIYAESMWVTSDEPPVFILLRIVQLSLRFAPTYSTRGTAPFGKCIDGLHPLGLRKPGG